MKEVYHIGKKSKTLCGRISGNIILKDISYKKIKDIIKESSHFVRLCVICDRIKKKQESKS